MNSVVRPGVGRHVRSRLLISMREDETNIQHSSIPWEYMREYTLSIRAVPILGYYRSLYKSFAGLCLQERGTFTLHRVPDVYWEAP